jgi:hypothetical protein
LCVVVVDRVDGVNVVVVGGHVRYGELIRES